MKAAGGMRRGNTFDPVTESTDVIRAKFVVTTYDDMVCGERVLRAPGGLYHYIATYCVSEQGELETNTRRLLEHHYDSLIVPMKQAVQVRAKREGIEVRR